MGLGAWFPYNSHMPIEAVLIANGWATADEVERCRALAKTAGDRLDRVIIREGAVSRENVLSALAEQFHMPVVDVTTLEVDAAVLALVPPKIVFRERVVPISRETGRLTVAIANPFELGVLDELRMVTGLAVEPTLADEEELHGFIRTHYGVGGDTLEAMSADLVEVKARGDESDEAEQAQEASVIKLVNDILAEAIGERATDIHIEPYEHELSVRYRIDGVLQKASVPATINRFGMAIISRLKIMANLNIAEKRKPQDGRITFKPARGKLSPRGGEEFDLRVSTIPMLYGEGVVLRVLSKTAAVMTLEQLGMPANVKAAWEKLIERPHGILLVTGPTGSGKSTTLYASLNKIVSDEIKVITIEDPVEYHVVGVNQIQVNAKVGLDFSAGLRAVLRHDPDVVMIGEIRDKETAETAVQASLTGHLVFSTLHTNDAAGSTTRLLDMGVEPFLVASSLEGVLAQRLVRRICGECKTTYVPDSADLPDGMPLPADGLLWRGTGCRNCRGTGYRGRVGVYELMRVSEETRHRITQRINSPVIAAEAKREGDLWLLREDGLNKAAAGLTTVEEVLAGIAV